MRFKGHQARNAPNLAISFLAFQETSSQPLFVYPEATRLLRSSFWSLRKLGRKSTRKTPIASMIPTGEGFYFYTTILAVDLPKYGRCTFCLLSLFACFTVLEVALISLKELFVALRPNSFHNLIPYLDSLVSEKLPEYNKTLHLLWHSANKNKTLSSENADYSYGIYLRTRPPHLPYVDDKSIELVSSLLEPESLISLIFDHLMLEHSLIVQTRVPEKLAYFIDGLLNLLYPFEWQGICIPIACAEDMGSLANLLEMDCPFVVGMSFELSEKLKPKSSEQKRYVLLDIDIGTMENTCSKNFSDTKLPAYKRKFLLRELSERRYPRRKSSTEFEEKALSPSSSCASISSLMSSDSLTSGVSTKASTISCMSDTLSGSTCSERSSWRSRRHVDRVRTAFLEIALLHFWGVNASTVKTSDFASSGFNPITRMEIESQLKRESDDMMYLRNVAKTRHYADFVHRVATGNLQDFETIAKLWNDLDWAMKSEPVFQVLKKLLQEMGYGKETATLKSLSLMQLPFSKLNDALSCERNLEHALEELSDETEYTVITLQLSNLRNALRRPSSKSCPPLTHEIYVDSYKTVPTTLDLNIRCISNSACLSALYLAGNMSDACWQKKFAYEDENPGFKTVFALYREYKFFKDAFSSCKALGNLAINTAEVNLKLENDRLNRELQALTEKMGNPMHGSNHIGDDKGNHAKYPSAPKSTVNIISSKALTGTFAPSTLQSNKKVPNRPKRSFKCQVVFPHKFGCWQEEFRPLQIRRRNSALFKKANHKMCTESNVSYD